MSRRTTERLPAGQVLTVTADAGSSGTVRRVPQGGDHTHYDPDEIEAGDSQSYGPFTADRFYEVLSDVGQLTTSIAVADQDLRVLATASRDSISTDGKDYTGARSYQPIGPDLNLDADAGRNTADGTSYLGAVMGNVIGATLTKTANYLAGLIGKFSISGTKSTKYPAGGVLGIVGDNGSDSVPDAPVVSVLDGDSDQAKAIAFFKARTLNSTSGSGADYGVDLFDSEAIGLGYLQNVTRKAIVRSVKEVCWLEKAGVPTDGSGGDGAGFAEKGSLCTDLSNGNLYINGNTKASPTWKLVTRAA